MALVIAMPDIAQDLLIARLRWPVPLVRWRAARALRDLLNEPETCGSTSRALLAELAECRTEYRASEILTVFLCASPEARPTAPELTAHLRAPSIASSILIRHICGDNVEVQWKRAHSGEAPPHFEPAPYFEEMRTSHASPRLSDNIFDFQKRTKRPFYRQWAWEWERLCDVTAAPFTRYPYYFDDFGDVKAKLQGHYLQSQADIYRSAYWRCFAFAVDQWGLAPHTVAHYCAEFLPIAADMFELDPLARPEWLGELPEICAADPDSLASTARAIVEAGRAAGEFPIAMHIPLSPEVEPYGYIKITAYFAAHDFRPGEGFEELPTYFVPAAQGLRISGPLPDQMPERGRLTGASGHAVPAAVDLIPLPFGQWQGTFSRIGMSVPSALIAGAGAVVRIEDHKMVVADLSGVIGSTRFWLDHWSPRAPLGGATPCGVLCTVCPEHLSDCLAANGAKIYWVAKLCLWRREREYEEYSKQEHEIGFFDG